MRINYHQYKLITIIGGDIIVIDNNRHAQTERDARKIATLQHSHGLAIARGTGASVNTKLYRLIDEYDTAAEPNPRGYTEQG